MEERIFNVLARVMDVPVECIKMDSSPNTLDVWDSLKHLNLVHGLEEEFCVQFEIEEIMEMMNVEMILITLNRKMKSK